MENFENRPEKNMPPQEVPDERPADSQAEGELSPELFEKVMEKVFDINEPGTPHHIISTARSKINEKDVYDQKLSAVLESGILGSPGWHSNAEFQGRSEWAKELREEGAALVHFRMVGRMGPTFPQAVSPTEISQYFPDLGVTFNLDKSSEVKPITHKWGRTAGSVIKDLPRRSYAPVKEYDEQRAVRDDRGNIEASREYGFVLRNRVRPNDLTGIFFSVANDNFMAKELAVRPLAKKLMVCEPKERESLLRQYYYDTYGDNVKKRFKELLRKKSLDEYEAMELAMMTGSAGSNSSYDTDESHWQARAQMIAETMLAVYKDKPELILPIYGVNGKLYWPKEMSYEDVQDLVSERDNEGK